MHTLPSNEFLCFIIKIEFHQVAAAAALVAAPREPAAGYSRPNSSRGAEDRSKRNERDLYT